MKTLATLVFTISFLYSFAQDLDLELIASNFDRPVSIKNSGDGRLFIAEQDGVIKIIGEDGTIQNGSFLDINDRVINSGNERGLLGLAFHPNHETNGYFYVNYINNSGNTVISRFTLQWPNPSLANPNSELEILTYSQPFDNHNGGDMAFGPDGYLYISSGDGGSGGDPQNNSQNTSNLLGKILRIDINSTTATENYVIPPDNPFAGSTSAREEIWAYGLRNPWKFSFDRMNGDIWIADVGQDDYEEINRASGSDGGLNYGWRCYEGNAVFNSNNCPNSNTLTFPVSAYNHFTDGQFKCSITGGYRYRGTNYPNFEGRYFFADACSQEIGYLIYNDVNDTWSKTFQQFSGSLVAFGEDNIGELYVSTLGGDIYKLVDNTLSQGDNLLNSISVYPNPTKNQFNISFGNFNTSLASFKIAIYDLHGKIVKNVNRNTDTIQKINTSDLSTGIYVLKVSIGNGEQSIHKLVIN
ncbi:hypothetical protein FBALC1_10237 [Flavobacteriales bacterium ALC-1]|nr:hypothetical protein FBALC1_10237 [Flavobacteriales bacterium ALC-1]